MNEIKILPFGSGSTGNSVYIEIGPYHLLVDMGIGFRKIRDTLFLYDRDISSIEAIFVTHGHYDHIKSAKAIANHVSCDVYCDSSALYPIRDISARRVVIEPYEMFEPLEGLYVTMFSLPHDYVHTNGYIFEYEDKKVGYVTDCGKMNDTILSYLYGSDVVILESNHDVEMLKNGPYPKQLQDRILSKFGHLSNKEAAETIEKLYDKGTRNFLLAHLSLQNNTPEIALKTAQEKMEGKDVNIFACPDIGQTMYRF